MQMRVDGGRRWCFGGVGWWRWVGSGGLGWWSVLLVAGGLLAVVVVVLRVGCDGSRWIHRELAEDGWCLRIPVLACVGRVGLTSLVLVLVLALWLMCMDEFLLALVLVDLVGLDYWRWLWFAGLEVLGWVGWCLKAQG